MKFRKAFALMALLVLFASASAIARGGRGKARVTAQTRFLDATSQRTIPGARGMEPSTAWKFLVIWGGAQPPETFFWRPDANRWMTCALTRIHHYSRAPKGKLAAYNREEIDLKQVRRGDTLEIVAMPMGRDQMPAAVRGKQRGTLYYQTGLSRTQWLYLTPSVRKLEDILMP